MTLKVCFNSVEEFLAELQRHPPNVDHLVRVTNSFRSNSVHPSIRAVSVVAGYLRCTGSVIQLIELTRYCGDDFCLGSDRKVMARAEDIITQIEVKTRALSLSTAAGMYHLNHEPNH